MKPKSWNGLRVVLFSVGLGFTTWTAARGAGEPRVQFSDLQYLGAFRGPACSGQNCLDNGGRALAYRPPYAGQPKGSLFVSCGWTSGQIAEISIPNPVNTTDANALSQATFLQGCADPSLGGTYRVSGGAQAAAIGGIIVNGSQLIVSFYLPYDAASPPEQQASHYVKPSLTLALPNASGPYAVRQQGVDTSGNTGFTSGPMAWIPDGWRSRLGGNSLIAWNCCISIGSRTSFGPAAFAFNPNNMGSVSPNVNAYPVTPAPSVPLLYYDNSHQTIGDSVSSYDGVNVFYNPVVVPAGRGMVIPDGTSSALYFTGVAMGPVVYKGPPDCYSNGSGYSGFPYKTMIFAYDVNDWAKTAADRAGFPPYGWKPYGAWTVSGAIPFTDGQCDANSGGAAYDAANQLVYWVSTQHDPLTQYSAGPIFHLWRLAAGSSAPTSPAAPRGLRVR